MIVVFALISALLDGVSSLAYKKIDDQKTITGTFGIGMWSLIAFLPIVLIYGINNFNSLILNVNLETFLITSLYSILGIFCIFFWIKSIKYLAVSFCEASSRVIVVLLGFMSWLIFGDKLNVVQIIFMGIILVTVVYLNIIYNKQEEDVNAKKNIKKGLICLGLWIFFNVSSSLLLKVAVIQINVMTFKFFDYIIYCLCSFIILLFVCRKNKAKEIKSAFTNKWNILIGCLNIFTETIYVFFAKDFNMGLVSVLFNLDLIVVILFSRFVYKEKISKTMWISIIIIFASTIILGLIS